MANGEEEESADGIHWRRRTLTMQGLLIAGLPVLRALNRAAAVKNHRAVRAGGYRPRLSAKT